MHICMLFVSLKCFVLALGQRTSIVLSCNLVLNKVFTHLLKSTKSTYMHVIYNRPLGFNQVNKSKLVSIAGDVTWKNQ